MSTAVAEKTRPTTAEQAAPLPRKPRELPEVQTEMQKAAKISLALSEAESRYETIKEEYERLRQASGGASELQRKAMAIVNGQTYAAARDMTNEVSNALSEVDVLREAVRIQQARVTEVQNKAWGRIREGLVPEWAAICLEAADGADAVLAAKKKAQAFMDRVPFGYPFEPILNPYLPDERLAIYAADLRRFIATGVGNGAATPKAQSE